MVLFQLRSQDVHDKLQQVVVIAWTSRIFRFSPLELVIVSRNNGDEHVVQEDFEYDNKDDED